MLLVDDSDSCAVCKKTRFYVATQRIVVCTHSLRTITAVILRLWAFEMERLSCTWETGVQQMHKRKLVVQCSCSRNTTVVEGIGNGFDAWATE